MRIKLLTCLVVIVAVFCTLYFRMVKRHEPRKPENLEDTQLLTNWLEKSKIAWHPLYLATNQHNAGKEWDELESLNEKIHSRKWNLTPDVIGLIAAVEDSDELYRLDNVLAFVSSFSLADRYKKDSLGMEKNAFKQELPGLKAKFLQDWRSGSFDNCGIIVTQQLANVKIEFTYNIVHPKTFLVFKDYGIYALPSIINGGIAINSSIALGAFLFITQSPLYYSIYRHKPENTLASLSQKADFVRDWWSREHTKFNELHPLYEKIDAAVKALPNLPIETNAVTSGSSP